MVVLLIRHGTTELLASEIYLLSLALGEILYSLGPPAQLYCMQFKTCQSWLCYSVVATLLTGVDQPARVPPFDLYQVNVSYEFLQC